MRGKERGRRERKKKEKGTCRTGERNMRLRQLLLQILTQTSNGHVGECVTSYFTLPFS